MQLKEFQANRERIPLAEIMKHRGQWIAITSDGRRIVAANTDLATLDSLIVAAGESYRECCIGTDRGRRRVSRRSQRD